MRVAQLITTLARGGAQATVLASSNLSHLGVDVTVLAGLDDPGEGTHWIDVDRAGLHVVAVPALRRAIDPRNDATALGWLIRWLRANRPDVLHTHSAKAGVIGRLAAAVVGVPAVHTIHGWSFGSPLQNASASAVIHQRTIVGVERVLARRSKALVVVTPLDAERGLAMKVGTAGKYHVIRSGIELDQPQKGQAWRQCLRAELSCGPGEFVVGSVGRLARQKDLATLIAGFAQADIDNSRLVLIGDGPQRQDLERRAAELGLSPRVQVLGQRPDAARLLGGFDVFALTSRWEGLPRTLIEAMAAGVPVIATPVGGVPEIVRAGETGTLVPIGDVAAVAEALRSRFDAPARHRAMADRAARLVEPFSADRMRSDLVHLWSEIAKRPAPHTAANTDCG